MHKKWFVQKTNPEYVSYLSSASSVSPALAQVLINRGIKTPEAVKCFLECSPSDLSDPFSLEGMEAVIEAIDSALEAGTKVLVHGDYDCDGITATAIMVEALRAYGLQVASFIPNRFDHGYGFNLAGLEAAKEAGAGLVVTVDCGITSFEAASAAAAEGIALVVTDHHEPHVPEGATEPLMPEAQAVINPKLWPRDEHNPALSGAGLAFRVAQALDIRRPGLLDSSSYFDLAALGTLADSVPLRGENRIIVREGTKRIISRDRLGIAALMDAAGLSPAQLKSGRLQFTLVPRINAVGRLADATKALELMLATSPGQAATLAHELNEYNNERKKIEEQVFLEAVEDVEKAAVDPVIVLAREGWHEGVVGIVASKLVDRYARPAIVLSIKGDRAKGSARSVPGFDMYAALCACASHLKAFGGHKQAAGMTVGLPELQAFRDAMALEAQTLSSEPEQTLSIDAAISLGDVSFSLVEELGRLEPFGLGNPEPVLGAKGLEILNARIVGRGHLKMRLRSNSTSMDAIGFNMGDFLDTVEGTKTIDAAFAATINVWEDRRTLQLNLKDLRKSEGAT